MVWRHLGTVFTAAALALSAAAVGETALASRAALESLENGESGGSRLSEKEKSEFERLFGGLDLGHGDDVRGETWPACHLVEDGQNLIQCEVVTRTEQGEELRRQLIEFPVICDKKGSCETKFDCWALSVAIDGLNMDDTCQLIEKLQGMNDFTIDDWLAELPAMLSLLAEVDSILGVLKLKFCTQTAKHLSDYETVFEFPKGICLNQQDFTGCLWELAFLFSLPLEDPLKGLLPDDTVAILGEIRMLTLQVIQNTPRICHQLDRVDLFSDNSILKFVDKWESLFEKTGDGKSTKLELLLDVLTTLTNWELVRDYLPKIPRGCSKPLSKVATNIYDNIFGDDAKAESIPNEICAVLGPSDVVDCLSGLANNIDEIDWIAESLGNGNLQDLAVKVLPTLCASIDDLMSLSVDTILEQLPLILRTYSNLGLDVLNSVLPGVNKVVIECGDEFAETVENIEDALADPITLLEVICGSSINGNKCILELGKGIDKLSFVSGTLGEGTMTKIFSESVPEACELTERVLPDGSETQIDAISIVQYLPEIINWYKSLTEIQVFQPILARWPDEECDPDVIEDITSNLVEGLENTAKLPSKICVLTKETPRKCMLAFADSLQETPVIRSAFSASVSKEGPKEVLSSIVNDILPAFCKAVDGTSIDAADLVRAIPILLGALNELDILPLRNIIPEIHEVLSDRTCSRQFESLLKWIADIIDGKDDQTVSKICRRIARNQCLVDLSRALDEVQFIRDEIGRGTLELVVDDILPEGCASMTSATKGFNVKNLLHDLPDLLLVVDKLTSRSNDHDGERQDGDLYPLQSYLPQIPTDIKCRQGYQAIAKSLTHFVYEPEPNLSLLVEQLCKTWPEQGYIECIGLLGDAFDEVPLIVNFLGAKRVLRIVSDSILPSACGLLLPAESLSDSTSTLVEKLPEIVLWYASLQSNIPGFLSEYLPAFPKKRCPRKVLDGFANHIKIMSEIPSVESVLSLACRDLTNNERKCIVAIGSSIDGTDALLSAAGIPKGFLQQIIEVDLPTACGLIGDKFESINIANMVVKIPEILRFVTTLRETLPEFLSRYLPEVPHDECDEHFESATEKFVKNLNPLEICNLSEEEAECIAKLGDNIDEIELIRDLIGKAGLVRFAAESVRDRACDVIESIGELNYDTLSQQIPELMKAVDELNSFPVLDPLIPNIPAVCDDKVGPLTSKLWEVATENQIQVLCETTEASKLCFSELGFSLGQVDWISGIVPNTQNIALDLLKLLPVVCSVLMDGASLDQADRILTSLPTIVSLFDSFRDVDLVQAYIPTVSDECMLQYHQLANRLSGLGLEGVPTALCEMPEKTKLCLSQIKWDGVVPDSLPAQVVESLPFACESAKSLGSGLSYENILTSLPHLLDLLESLNEADALSAYIPDLSEDCRSLFKKQTIPRMLNDMLDGICGISKMEKVCFKNSFTSILEIELIAKYVEVEKSTIPSLLDAVFDLVPPACAVLNGIHQRKNVFELLGAIVNVLEDFRSLRIFGKALPSIQSQCAQTYRDFFANLESSIGNSDLQLMLPLHVCQETTEEVGLCIKTLGNDLSKGSQLLVPRGVEIDSITEALVDTVMPEACYLVEQAIDLEKNEIRINVIVSNIPTIATIYDSLAQSTALLPNFPTEACSSTVLEAISGRILNLDDDILGFICIDLNQVHKLCLLGLGDVLDGFPILENVVGRPGMFRELFGHPLDAVCGALSFESEVSVTSILGHVDTVLHAVDVARSLAPSSVKSFLPEIPDGDCKSMYFPQISIVLRNFKVSNLCILGSDAIECIARLGDELEKTPLIRIFLYGNEFNYSGMSLIRNVAEALPKIICPLFDELGNLDFRKIGVVLPQALELVDSLHEYPVLRAYIPNVPDLCHSVFQNLELADVFETLCVLNVEQRNCVTKFGESMDDTEFGHGVGPVLQSILDLLPGFCKILGSGSVNTDNILRELPQMLKLVENLDVVAQNLQIHNVKMTEACHNKLQDFASGLALVKDLNDLPGKICEASVEDFSCMRKLGLVLDKLPFLEAVIPRGLLVRVINLLENPTCRLLSDSIDLDFASFVTSIPDVMKILSQLEEIDFIRGYLPVISPHCKETFGKNITEKILTGFERNNEFGLLQIASTFDFSGLTAILCDFSEGEEACFVEAVNGITEMPELSSIRVENYTLHEMVNTAFSIRKDACLLFEELGRLEMNSFFLSARAIVRILENLNRFPVLNQYVPSIGAACIEAFENITNIMVGERAVSKICTLNPNERDCMPYVASKLDKIAEVRLIFSLATGTSESIENLARKLLSEGLDPACEMMSDVGVDMEGLNLAQFVSKVPGFLNALRTLQAIPFLSNLAPKVTEECLSTLEEFALVAARAKGQAQGVKLVCAADPSVRNCLLEMDQAFEKVEFIGRHIPDGVVELFLDSVQEGCKVFDRNLNRTAYFKHDLPLLFIKAGRVARVRSECLNERDGLCGKSDECLHELVTKISGLPLFGQFVPPWTSDLLIDFCSVRAEEQSLSKFLQDHLINLVTVNSKSANCKEKDVSVSTPKGFCRTYTSDCVNELVLNLPNYVPNGIGELLQASCSFFNGEDLTIYGLLPNLPPLLDVLSLLLGYPSDQCASQLKENVLVSNFTAVRLCTGMSSQCVSEVVMTMRNIPFIGVDLPDATDQLIGAACAVLKDRSNYSALMQHLSTLFDLLGRIVTGGHMDLDEECQREAQLELFDARTGEFLPRYLCVVKEKCSLQLVNGLRKLPFIGEYVPESLQELMRDMCILQGKVQGDGYVKISEETQEGSKSIASVLPELIVLLGKIVSEVQDENVQRRVLLQECGRQLMDYGSNHAEFRIHSFCTELPDECIGIVSDQLELLPLLREFIHPRTGEILGTACDLINSEGIKTGAGRIPSLLLMVSDFLALNRECTERMEDLGILFKSRGGRIDAKDMCQKLRVDCMNEFATKIQQLPFVGSYIPDGMKELIEDTCGLIDDSILIDEYIEREGKVLLDVASNVVDAECSDFFHSRNDISAVTLCERSDCLKELAERIQRVPLVGEYLPEGVPVLFDGICEWIHSKMSWTRFTKEIFGNLVFAITRSTIPEDESCAYQLKRLGEQAAGIRGFTLKLCRVKDECLENLLARLSNAPLWKEYIPRDVDSTLTKVCSLGNAVDVVKMHWKELMALFTHLVPKMKEGECGKSLQQFFSACENRGACLVKLVAEYREMLPLVSQIIPRKMDGYIAIGCSIFAVPEQHMLEEIFRSGGVLDNLVIWLPFDEMESTTPSCSDQFLNASKSDLAGKPGSWRSIFSCGEIDRRCLDVALDEALSYTGSTISTTQRNLIKSIVMDQDCPDNQQTTQKPTMEPHQRDMRIFIKVGIAVGIASFLTAMFFVLRIVSDGRKAAKRRHAADILDRRSSRAIIPGIINFEQENCNTQEEIEDEDEDEIDENDIAIR